MALTVVLSGSWDGAGGVAAQRALEANDPKDAAFRDLKHFWREWPWAMLAPATWLMLTFWVSVVDKSMQRPGHSRR